MSGTSATTHRDLVGRRHPLDGYGPDWPCRLIGATTDPATLPVKATWYLATNLPHPDAPHVTTGPLPLADLAEMIPDPLDATAPDPWPSEG